MGFRCCIRASRRRWVSKVNGSEWTRFGVVGASGGLLARAGGEDEGAAER